MYEPSELLYVYHVHFGYTRIDCIYSLLPTVWYIPSIVKWYSFQFLEFFFLYFFFLFSVWVDFDSFSVENYYNNGRKKNAWKRWKRRNKKKVTLKVNRFRVFFSSLVSPIVLGSCFACILIWKYNHFECSIHQRYAYIYS